MDTQAAGTCTYMIRDGIPLLPIRRGEGIAPDDADGVRRMEIAASPGQHGAHQPEKTPWIRITMEPIAGFSDTTAYQDVVIHRGLICDMTSDLKQRENSG